MVQSVLAYRFFFFFQAEDGIRAPLVTGVQTCALPIFASSLVTGTDLPPPAATRWRTDVGAGAKTIVPSRFHVPPTPLSASQMVRTAPPEGSIRFNFPSAKKPTKWPSGDQNGKKAFSAPTTGRAEDSWRLRIQRAGCPPGFAAVKTRRVPSGESASSPRNIFSGKGRVARMPGEGRGARRTYPAANAMAAIAAIPNPTHARRSRLLRLAMTGAGTPAADPTSAIHWSWSLASWAVWKRSSASFARQVLTTRSSAGGVIGWSVAIGAGSSFMIAEINDAWLA